MKEISADLLRIIDANINRMGEGLRVLEEFARLSLNDTVITQQLKNMRHTLVNTGGDLQNQLLGARDAAGDVGGSMDVLGEVKTRDASEAIFANARRVQESLRVMEEMSKAPGLVLNSEVYRQARFELYTIEKELLARILRQDKIKRLAGLYVVIDTAWLKGRRPEEIAKQAIRGGAKVIQLRCKERSTRDFLTIAMELKAVCSEYAILFIVNDSLEVALACGADGLHIGQDDLPAKTARKLIPIDMILGISVSTVDEAKAALAEGVDYLGVGAIFVTPTKESAKAVGLGRLKEIKKAFDLPVVAIGGINKENLSAVMKAGADSAAVISAVLGAKDVEKVTRQLVDIIGGQKNG
ncbi:MAG: thiamine-phosphate diphosphorylase [Chloroflexi bacterium RBG_13_52_12]|nr:MAG: thiamine-phosphate diphosphorylase [Chloroflexi bacterium RBG_13_52_12]